MGPDMLHEVAVVAERMVGRPYGFGGEWNLNDPDPKGPVDCSELVEWCYFRALHVRVPDGAHAQWLATIPIASPWPGDVGFWMAPTGSIHHVGIVRDMNWVIEARGAPFGQVIMRPRMKWEEYPEFKAAGGWRRFKVVEIG